RLDPRDRRLLEHHLAREHVVRRGARPPPRQVARVGGVPRDEGGDPVGHVLTILPGRLDTVVGMALHPVGPLPASTYWRRRLVLVVALVVLVLVARSCVGSSGSKPSPRANVTPTSTRHPRDSAT